MLLPVATTLLALLATCAEARLSSTTPPRGAIVVRQHNPKKGEYSTFAAAVKALGNSSSKPASIFAYRGNYQEQVYLTYPGPLTLIGETKHPRTYKSSLVTITYNISKNEAGNNDKSGTLRVHKNNFSMYNINLANTYGHPVQQSQALALSAYGDRQGYYASSFTGWQDTVMTYNGSQYFGSCSVTGAVDFIFGETAATYLKGSDIFPIGAGSITAGRPKTNVTDGMGIYVFDECTIKQSKAATTDLTGLIYLGRPWGDYARSIFKNSYLSDVINPAGWSIWSSTTPNVDNVVYGEYRNTGPGSRTSQRANFSTVLTSKQSREYGIDDILGGDWRKWVDEAYY